MATKTVKSTVKTTSATTKTAKPAAKTTKKTTAKRPKTKKKLVIVESPSKAKTIGKYLGRTYKVVASLGHVRDLPKSRMGVDIENDYQPDYISIRGKGDVIKELRKDAKQAKAVYLASDPDREGEAIAWHVANLLKLDTKDKNRVTFNEITKDAVKEAFKEPREINMDLVDAQQARRVLDRLVGYSISPILWKKVKKGLSAGRVQSVALNLIIQREQAIRDFKPEEYWTIDGQFKKGSDEFAASFYGENGKKAALPNNEAVQKVLAKINRKAPFTIDDVTRKERKRMPQPPYTTSTMQQDANRRLNFRTRKTMMAAQQLYEGITLGHGSAVGLITYMRTDSTRIASIAKQEASQFIHENYGEQYAAIKPVKGKLPEGAQDAHEAIRPTSVNRTPAEMKQYLTADQYKLYSLIWSRFVASQMTPQIVDTMVVSLSQNGVDFHANGSKVKFDGFTKVYKRGQEKDNVLPDLNQGDQVQMISDDPAQHFTQPPARYTEAALIKTLEENGVGLPPTRQPWTRFSAATMFVWYRATLSQPNWVRSSTRSSSSSSQKSSMSSLRPKLKTTWTGSKKARKTGLRSLTSSTSHFLKKSRLLRNRLLKSKCMMNWLAAIVRSAGRQWSLRWAAMASSMPARASRTAATPRQSSKISA